MSGAFFMIIAKPQGEKCHPRQGGRLTFSAEKIKKSPL
jgi:hypothetical protein